MYTSWALVPGRLSTAAWTSACETSLCTETVDSTQCIRIAVHVQESQIFAITEGMQLFYSSSAVRVFVAVIIMQFLSINTILDNLSIHKKNLYQLTLCDVLKYAVCLFCLKRMWYTVLILSLLFYH